MVVLKKVIKYVVYSVTFSVDEMNYTKPVYFANIEDAKKCAILKRGWFGSGGSYDRHEYNSADIPSYYDNFNEWAEDTLTVKEYKSLNI